MSDTVTPTATPTATPEGDAPVEPPSAGAEAPEAPPGEAVAAAEPEATEKPKVDTEAEKQQKLTAKRLAEHARREASLRRAQSEVQAQRHEIEGLRAQVVERDQHVEQIRQTLSDYIQSIKQDPITWLRDELGIGPEEYYSRVMNGGKPSREEQFSDQTRTLQQELAEMKRQLAEREQRETEREKQWREEQERRQAEAAEQAAVQAREDFWQLLSGSADQYPDIMVYPKELVLKEAAQLVEQLGARADSMSYEDIAKLLQDSTREWHEQVYSKRYKTSATPAAAPPVTDAEPAVTPTAKPNTRKRIHGRPIPEEGATLNGSLTSRATVTAKLPFELEKEKLKRELEAANVRSER